MLTFLRKIRKSLIESGAARKYVLYAIGEIALVVIGILIALEINNWNEGRKTRRQLSDHLENLAIDLNEDIAEYDEKYSHHHMRFHSFMYLLDLSIFMNHFLTLKHPGKGIKNCIHIQIHLVWTLLNLAIIGWITAMFLPS